MLKVLYILYQYLFALPIFFLITVFTSLFTICTTRWKNSEWVHREQQFWSKSIFWLLGIRVTVDGLENITPGQSYIFVANHQSMLDVWAIYGWLPVIFKWMMKKELEKMPFIGSGCKAAGHIFVDRSNPRAAVRSIKAVEATLKNGVCTVIFPEGTRSKTGVMGSFKRGAFMIAEHVGLPVIPISLSGCHEAWPVGKYYATRAHVHMHVGAPIILSDHQSAEDPAAAMNYVRDVIAAGIK